MTEEKNKDLYGKILAVLFMVSGLSKLIGIKATVDNFNNWHLGDTWRYIAGTIELVFGIMMMFFPALKKSAAFGCFIIMACAFIVHIIAKEYLGSLLPVIVGTALFYYLIKQEIVRLK